MQRLRPVNRTEAQGLKLGKSRWLLSPDKRAHRSAANGRARPTGGSRTSRGRYSLAYGRERQDAHVPVDANTNRLDGRRLCSVGADKQAARRCTCERADRPERDHCRGSAIIWRIDRKAGVTGYLQHHFAIVQLAIEVGIAIDDPAGLPGRTGLRAMDLAR